MKFDISKIDEAIDKAFEFSGTKVGINNSHVLNSESNFLSVYSALVEKYGFPDYPCDLGSQKLLDVLDIEENLVAIWDFDYYQLSLRKDNNEAVLTKHDT